MNRLEKIREEMFARDEANMPEPEGEVTLFLYTWKLYYGALPGFTQPVSEHKLVDEGKLIGRTVFQLAEYLFECANTGNIALGHRSMSVGDVILFEKDGETIGLKCANVGWVFVAPVSDV